MKRVKLLPEEPPKSLYVIDGHSQIFRAIFSPGPPLTSPDGEPTSGTFIFTRMLLKLVRSRNPDFLVVAMDSPRKTLVRKQLFPAYKENREHGEIDESIVIQIKRIRQVIRALGIPMIAVEGWEADDVIASLIKKFGAGRKTYIITRDKDFHQIVTDDIVCYDPQTEETVRVDDVLTRWGVDRPSQVLDVQMLAGDSTDNVPGVKGIGIATATKLVNTYGSALAAKQAADGGDQTMRPSIREKLQNADLDLCQMLVELNPDIPLYVSEDDIRFTGLDMNGAAPLFESLGFRRLATVSKFVAPNKKPNGFWKPED